MFVILVGFYHHNMPCRNTLVAEQGDEYGAKVAAIPYFGLHEFGDFVARGNVMDLAVGVIMGGAFGKIVTSLVDDGHGNNLLVGRCYQVSGLAPQIILAGLRLRIIGGDIHHLGHVYIHRIGLHIERFGNDIASRCRNFRLADIPDQVLVEVVLAVHYRPVRFKAVYILVHVALGNRQDGEETGESVPGIINLYGIGHRSGSSLVFLIHICALVHGEDVVLGAGRDDNGGSTGNTSSNGTSSGNGTSSVNGTSSADPSVTVRTFSRFSGNKNISMYYFDGSKYSFKVYGDNGKLAGAGQVVVVKLNKKTYKLKTNKNGIVSLTIPKTVKPGKYSITASYKGQTIKNRITVKQILSSKKTVKVKRTAKKLVLTAKLKKKFKGKKITFKFRGKKYTAKTNKKGIAKVTIGKKVLKKLKKGKNYKLTITYYKVTLKAKVKKI